MRYSTRQYAEALFQSLEGKKGSVRSHILARFMKKLRQTRDLRYLNQIAVRYEEVLLKHKGMVKVVVESASRLPLSIKKEIEEVVGKPVELIQIIDPRLLAGIRILLNDSIQIDASALRRLERIGS